MWHPRDEGRLPRSEAGAPSPLSMLSLTGTIHSHTPVASTCRWHPNVNCSPDRSVRSFRRKWNLELKIPIPVYQQYLKFNMFKTDSWLFYHSLQKCLFQSSPVTQKPKSHPWQGSLHDSPQPFHPSPGPVSFTPTVLLQSLHVVPSALPSPWSEPPTSHPHGWLAQLLFLAWAPETPSLKKHTGEIMRPFGLELSNGFILHLHRSTSCSMANKALNYLSLFHLSNFIPHISRIHSTLTTHFLFTLPTSWTHQVLSHFQVFIHHVSLPKMFSPFLT